MKKQKKHRDKSICISMCDKKDRPELKWNGFGEVPNYTLPSTKMFPDMGVIPVKISTPYRESLETVYLSMNGMDIEFTGVVKCIKRNNIVFDRITFQDTSDYSYISDEYMEEHVWVRDIPSERMPTNIKIGDIIGFYGKVSLYRRKNGTLDYGIKDFRYIRKCKERHIPTKEELDIQHQERSLKKLACEICLYSEQCDGINCII